MRNNFSSPSSDINYDTENKSDENKSDENNYSGL